MTFFLGLDLGQAADPTALAVLERIPAPSPPMTQQYTIATPGMFLNAGSARSKIVPTRSRSEQRDPPLPHFHCRHLERLRLGTSYPAVAAHVQELLDKEPLEGSTQLVVDATGVGRPVVDMLEQRGLEPVGITITGGDQVVYERGWRVPKRDLVASVQVLLQTERLKFADQIPTVSALVQELLAFRVRIDPLTAHDSYGAAWREGSHDDLVLAVAVAAWWGQRYTPTRTRHYGTVIYRSV